MLPTLETARLHLRPLAAADAGALASLAGDWEIARMTTRIPHPYPPALAERWIAAQAAEAARREPVFAVELKEVARLVGCIGLERGAPGVYEVGYWIGRPWWGRGFATEALRALAGFAFQSLAAARLTAGHFVDNPASGRVLAKCGFRAAGSARRYSTARGAAVETLLVRRDRAPVERAAEVS